MKLLNVFDYEREAAKKLPQMAYDYYRSGAFDEITLQENMSAYQKIRLLPRILRNVSDIDLSVELFGQKLSMPLLVAPMAFQAMAHPEAEAATAQGVKRADITMLLSTLSTTPMETVVELTGGATWFQLYVHKDREMVKGLVQRAEKAGCKALVLTVDAPAMGRRERDVRNGFRLPETLFVDHLEGYSRDKENKEGGSGLETYFKEMLDASLTWEDVAWLRSITSLPVLLKGVMHPEDARLAVENGASGIVVSNHGGRQLDTAPATIEVLPAIAAQVDSRIPLLMDGGIRRGTDIVKALAKGADAVLVGRPILWGLTLEGSQGVHQILELLREELHLAMALCGCTSIQDINESLLWRRTL